jgi:hypothetical protein
LFALALTRPAFAHERIEVGPYVIILGWQNEPPVVGERNAILIEVSEAGSPVEGVESGLNLEVLYGGQSYRSNLNPAGEAGVYTAELWPTVRGQYSVHLVGAIGDTVVDVTVEPEEVFPGSRLQFPQPSPTPWKWRASSTPWRGSCKRRACWPLAASSPACWDWPSPLSACVAVSRRTSFVRELSPIPKPTSAQENKMKRRLTWLAWLLAALLALSLGVACAPTPSDTTSPDNAAGEHDEESEGGEHSEEGASGEGGEHDEGESETMRIPNEGAVVRIVSPSDGSIYGEGEEVVVQIEVENSALEEGHWHILVDGSSWGMVMGGNSDEVLRGLEPGEHDIEVFLSNSDHVELEQGDRVTIVVQE